MSHGRHALDLEAGTAEWRDYDDLYPDSEGDLRSQGEEGAHRKRGGHRWLCFHTVLNPHSRRIKVSTPGWLHSNVLKAVDGSSEFLNCSAFISIVLKGTHEATQGCICGAVASLMLFHSSSP